MLKSLFVLSLCFLPMLAVADALPLWRQPGYAEAIVKARNGDTGPALQLLQREVGGGNRQSQVVDDYLTVLAWAGRGREAVDEARRFSDVPLSAPTLRLLASAARDRHDYASAVELYRRLPEKQRDASWLTALAMAQAEAGADSQALATLDEADGKGGAGSALERVRARAYVLAAGPESARALAYAQSALARFPDDPDLARTYVGLLLRLHAPFEAAAAMTRYRLKDPVLQSRAELDQAAMLSHWGEARQQTATGLARFSLTDRALSDNQAAGSQLPPPAAWMKRGALDDRLIMLQQRGLSADAAREYEAAPLGAGLYAKAAVADAYLALRRPERALPLYRELAAASPDPNQHVEWHIGLVYALFESGRIAESRRELDTLLMSVPPYVFSYGRKASNPDYRELAQLDAMMDSYSDRTREAWQKLDALLEQAPHNANLRGGQAEVALARGWPRMAAGIYDRLRADDPDNYSAYAGLAQSAMDLKELDEAKRQIDYLRQAQPEWATLDRLERRWYWERRPELTVEAGKDLPGGGGAGVDELGGWDEHARLYSSPWGHWRLFALHDYATANYRDIGRVSRQDGGVGIQYRSAFGTAEAGLTAQLGGARGGGAFAGFGWTPDDYWTLGAHAEINTPDAPLKGRFDGVRGNAVQLSAAYRVSDYRSFGGQASYTSLSDGNRRSGLGANWQERWHSGPVYKLDTILALSAGRNSDTPSAIYYNPRSDFEADLTVAQEWRLWGRYDDSLHQRLGLTVGQYRQQGFGSGAVWGFYVEQEWRWSPRGGLTYGFARNRHPYDGAADIGNRIYVRLEWRF
ncbi:poly-beta-1,6 N-acetyl-D-glucosamine export porin PgaA [Chromobacterium violaceum]|uniref:poly-beta-1,6 N-acetyl-D-glucosamine export porin PgaA n=1 Tax=Chromobacterium violaceum TaxID=536 RepID=UPI0009D9F1CC|nr:poly-beta-1,6 N-acetyl-D-glucosamine export porin PgaA [Chromobacterium violaceum]ATP29303.1 poly-beta-1,6 N-acetyl-D-glucosamine export porin PgaA [Chromobacterium violaceum]ATP33210.1 poly-beta-1,6 N-acetyl-D-glucosamine export porin PgaA [Chromobacterium violaceum]OQS26820.1 poly-beta-1,6 N-acetyl-D-glucosamine export porin PgaA [Chromobacterium violaceum]